MVQKNENENVTGNDPSQGSSTERVVKDTKSIIDEGANAFSYVMSQPFSVFFAESYPEPPTPPEENVYSVLDENNNVVGTRVKPTMISPWKCEYYYTPQRQARIARHIGLASIAVVISIVTYFNNTDAAISAIPTFVVFSIILINEVFRKNGWAVWKYPMPEIPFLSQWKYEDFLRDIGNNIREGQETDDDAQEEYNEYVENNYVEYVTPVEKYNDDGKPSPATILTRWMNGTAHVDIDDIIEQSQGSLDKFSMKMLLSDNEMAWTDEDIVDKISQVTGSHPQQWEQAWKEYTS